MLSRVLIKKQKGRRWLTALAVTSLIVSTMTIVGSTLAVHDLDFQLDGDSNPATAPSTPGGQALDWESLFNADGTPTSEIDPAAVDGFNDGDFVRDFRSKAARSESCTAEAALSSSGSIFCTNDFTTFATGSKDSLDITEWQCNRDNNVNSKIDIMNAYAAQYITTGGDRIMYFGLDKNKDNGNNNVAFWFLRTQTDCSSSGGAVDFSGTGHADGDVLVVSAFTNGGGVSNIDAYRWDGTDDCIDNPDEPGACDGLPVSSGGDCKAAPALDGVCATTNSGPTEENDNITTSWLTSDGTLGVGHTVVPPDFFEGGINLTEVFGDAPSCFNVFIANTRSSQSLTATLFDFARGQLGGCETTLTTDAGDNGADGEVAPPADIDDGTVSSGTDTATLSIDGTDTWAGTLTWYLCGPDSALTTCDPDLGVEVTSRSVDNTSSGADFISGTANLTSAGKYCWTAVFEPDADTAAAGVEGAQDDGTNECFTVAPVTPTLSTTASCTNSPCILGLDTLSDTASLSGTASQPGSGGPSSTYPTINPTTPGDPANSQITWNLYAPGECDTGTPLVTIARDVSGDDTYPTASQAAVEYTPDPGAGDTPGDYVWVASYPGDGPNTNAATTTGCADAAETITVIGSASLTSAQSWLPNDTVTLTSNGGTLSGTLTVTLYEGTFTEDSTGCTPDGTATPVPDQQYVFNPSGATSPAAYSTTNSTFFVNAGNEGDYFWHVSYDDSGLDDPASHCESTAIDITD